MKGSLQLLSCFIEAQRDMVRKHTGMVNSKLELYLSPLHLKCVLFPLLSVTAGVTEYPHMDLRGRLLRVVTLNFIPFIAVQHVDDSDLLVAEDCVDLRVLKVLSRSLNFTWVLLDSN